MSKLWRIRIVDDNEFWTETRAVVCFSMKQESCPFVAPLNIVCVTLQRYCRQNAQIKCRKKNERCSTSSKSTNSWSVFRHFCDTLVISGPLSLCVGRVQLRVSRYQSSNRRVSSTTVLSISNLYDDRFVFQSSNIRNGRSQHLPAAAWRT